MRQKEVILLEYTVVHIAGNRWSDFQGPKGSLRSPFISGTVLTGQWVNEVSMGFL